MRKLRQRLRNFFFPPAGSSRWIRILPYAVLGVLTLLVISAGTITWEYTNSPEFCGTSCHTMPPEYTSYLISPHARIACVECHIGKGFIATRITRKAGDLKHVVKTAFHSYEFPIRADDLRPARETCELCHFPEKFSDDSLRKIRRYKNDQVNTPIDIYLSLKTGGGSQRQGLGRGIHWHIENKVYYLSTDPEEQVIPYVKTIDNAGQVVEYLDIKANIDPSEISQDDLKEMDCITCHNRITHLVAAPEDTVDKLIAGGLISAEIPDIRRQAIDAYSTLGDTQEFGLKRIAGIETYFQTYFPEYYAGNLEKIRSAIQALQDAYSNSVYPEQNSNWSTHPNNIGHKDYPGCFRCHDGNHLDGNAQAIRLECNLCHSIPIVAGPDDNVTTLEINRGQEPETHLNTNWISLHNEVFDQSCESCHNTADAGGTSNTSFCSNSACHGSVWTYAGFDAPKLREILQAQIPKKPTPVPLPEGTIVTYENLIGAILVTRCGSCHGENGMQGLNLTSYASLMVGGENGAVVIPGSPQDSLIYQIQSTEIPHFGQLSGEELDQLNDWILSGAVEK